MVQSMASAAAAAHVYRIESQPVYHQLSLQAKHTRAVITEISSNECGGYQVKTAAA
jgi:hypothetical protein